ncbi:MAG TPA: DinB family protein [Thermoanaerobaculaceae bacterium]|nr:DinB family protein [Thermoanaerobaculaceae bacterium]
MADLLEALIQIKALAETPPRVTTLLRLAPADAWARRPRPGTWAPIEVLAHLADTELFHGTRVRLILNGDRPLLPRFEGAVLAERARYLEWPPALALERFCTRRTETLELLSVCSAAQLERVGVYPTRGLVTLADLVALMLAHDTDHVGQMRERLGITGDA